MQKHKLFAPKITLSWLHFVLLSAFFFTCMNFNFFIQIYQNLDSDSSLALKLSFPVIYFALAISVLSAPPPLTLFLKINLYKILLIPLIWISCLSAYFMFFYGVIIDRDMIDNVLKTDTQEVFDLLSPSLLIFIFLFGILPTLLIIKTHIIYPKTLKWRFLLPLLTFLGGLVFAVGIFYSQSQTLIPFFRNHIFLRVYETPTRQIYSAVLCVKQSLPQKEFEEIAKDATLRQDSKRKLMVFVLGETARAANYSLGGYSINDTNIYTKEKSIAYFDNFYSCGTSTAISVPCMFSDLSKENFSKSAHYRENALDILQKVGVNVIWLGNNSGGCQGVCKNLEKVKSLKSPYDENLLLEVSEQLKSLKEQNLIIVHLQGSHGPLYYQRYPDAFKRFLPTCDTNELQKCSQEELRNTYDNTILYTDFIVKSLIDMLEEIPEYETSLIYLSDHGESLGENGIYLHGMPYFIAPKEQIHIPFIFFSSNPALMQIAQSRKSLPLSQDNIFSTLLGYFGVESDVYQVRDDLLNIDSKEGES
ncbi:phosphoethanolamine--lipid A transferase [Helicobacter sp. MIT 05-5294]|uniref:phosphoethanolamine transferase n=1 Tax=Helicobacter sp. MIT 05-5294 TaxID=1548150 RepID=UPI0010FEA408|nr:phosphoethanolamine--lipid A transferase [Helicobacter sp. MIT 05-5294]TLD85509.1 phosphoethanolamine--lipid A transferase [Helicobacter sp. MIT 05-5294]